MDNAAKNNFDLIRLLAATQVMLLHCYEHLHFSSPLLNSMVCSLRFIPGVPVFFTVSGFLIFASYDNRPYPASYSRNRFLRIYPALWVCLLFTIMLLVITGFINSGNIFSRQLWAWLGTQVSVFQFYTPPMLRGFGVGNPNGSLWTIPVEISFYIAVPFIFFLSGGKRSSRNAWLLLLIALSVAYNIFYQQYKFREDRSTLIKLMGVNLAPYLFYFLLGAAAYINRHRIHRLVHGKALIWLVVYFMYCAVCSVWLKKFEPTYWTGSYHFIAVILLTFCVISCAFSYEGLSVELLRGNDLSYGIYLYHMPVINLLLMMRYNGTMSARADVVVLMAVAGTTLLAFLSWRFVERPALSLKKVTVRNDDALSV